MCLFHDWSKWSDVEYKTRKQWVNEGKITILGFMDDPQYKEVTYGVQKRICLKCGIYQEREI